MKRLNKIFEDVGPDFHALSYVYHARKAEAANKKAWQLFHSAGGFANAESAGRHPELAELQRKVEHHYAAADTHHREYLRRAQNAGMSRINAMRHLHLQFGAPHPDDQMKR